MCVCDEQINQQKWVSLQHQSLCPFFNNQCRIISPLNPLNFYYAEYFFTYFLAPKVRVFCHKAGG
jgi:hypothetical protein